MSQADHSATGHEAHAHHELPNFVVLLQQLYPEDGFLKTLVQWQNPFFAFLTAGIIVFFTWLAFRKPEMIPSSKLQNLFESIVEGVYGFVEGILGSHAKKHLPFLGTVFFYVLLMNWGGLVPFWKSATASWSTTVALGFFTMFYVQWTGFKEQGFTHYVKHLSGNPSNLIGILLIPLMLAINLILEFGAAPFSLSLRLFANISSEDRLLFEFARLTLGFHILLFLFQLFANLLVVIFSLIQAFVFMLLSTVYLALVLPHDDHAHEEEEHSTLPSHSTH